MVKTRQRLNTVRLRALVLSIFTTVALLFAPSLSFATPANICFELFDHPKAEPAATSDLVALLKERGFPIANRRGISVSDVKSQQLSSQLSWSNIKSQWLAREKSKRRPGSPQTQTRTYAEANLIEGIAKLLQEQNFSSRFEFDTNLRLTAIDKHDPAIRRTFDLSRILRERKFAVEEFGRMETLALTRLVIEQSNKMGIKPDQLTERGVHLLHPLRLYAGRSEADLLVALKQQMKLLSKNTRNANAGLEAARITGEMLLRRGFEIEILPSARGVFLAHVTGCRLETPTEFAKLIESVKAQSGSWFVMDPTYYVHARSDGVSDMLLFDYSFNTTRLWTHPEDLERASATMIHEIFHLTNARYWMENPEDENSHALNGWLYTEGPAELNQFEYKRYFQIDEIPAALLDVQNSTTTQDRMYYANRALNLARAVRERIDVTRSEMLRGHFTTLVSDSGALLMVEARSSPPDLRGEYAFVFNFSDLTEHTPRYTIVKRFVRRLDILEARLNELTAEAHRVLEHR